MQVLRRFKSVLRVELLHMLRMLRLLEPRSRVLDITGEELAGDRVANNDLPRELKICTGYDFGGRGHHFGEFS